MRKYIDAEKLKAFMRTMLTGNDLYTPNGIDEFVDGLPAEDVVKRVYRRPRPSDEMARVRHGRWIMHIDDLFPEESTMECDQCHEEQPLECDDNYCPSCGAKMEGDK